MHTQLLMQYLFLILVVLPVVCLHRCAIALDRWLYPNIESIEVRQPLFIVGLPRSGTTCLHRLIATQTSTFTTMPLWELVFAPALCQKYFWAFIFRCDEALGGWGARLLRCLEQLFFRDPAAIHATGLAMPEEDFLAMLAFDGCFLRCLLWPFSSRTWALGYFSAKLAPQEKQALLRAYHGIISRHVCFRGTHLRYLSKNPSFTGWLPDLMTQYPNGRFIGLQRDPVAVVASQLSSLDSALRWFGHRASDPRIAKQFVCLLAHYREVLVQSQLTVSDQRFQLLHYRDLVAQPFTTVTGALSHLQIELTADQRENLRCNCAATQRYTSRHCYRLADFGLHASEIAHAFRHSESPNGLRSNVETVDAKQLSQPARVSNEPQGILSHANASQSRASTD